MRKHSGTQESDAEEREADMCCDPVPTDVYCCYLRKHIAVGFVDEVRIDLGVGYPE
jgi:hypothetical protein